MVARALAADGHDVLLFCQQDSPLAEWSHEDSYQVDRSLNLNHMSPAMIFRGTRALRRALRDFRPDILNPHCPPGHSFLALARRLEHTAMPLVRTVAEPRSPKLNPVSRYLHEQATQGLIYTTASSRARYARSFSLSRVREAVILPGFRAEEFARNVSPAPLKKQLGLSDDTLLLGIVARMSPEKGQEVLIEALAKLPADIRGRLHVLLTGDDSRERGQAQLRELAERCGVRESLTFQPRYEDIRPVIAALDVGLITSVRSEAVCRIALEYMSFSKPIISSDVNILPEVVRHEQNGWVYPNRDATALANRLELAVRNPELRAKYGKYGSTLVHSEFSMKQELESVLKEYQSLLAADKQ